MSVYWLLFFISLSIVIIEVFFLKPEQISSYVNKSSQYKKKEIVIVLFLLIPLLVFVSFRDYVLDTIAYVQTYQELPTNWKQIIDVAKQTNGYAFIIISGLIKNFISENYYVWFFLLALINIWCIQDICIRNSPNLALSFYFFIAGTTFTWCINGTRQFLIVTLLFLCSKILLDNSNKGKWIYIVLLIGGSYIHASALVLIPIILFVSSKKIYGKGMILILMATLVGTVYSDSIIPGVSDIMGKDYTEAFAIGTGASVIRLLFTCVPTVLVLLNLKHIRKIAPPAVIFGINMSLVGACFMFAASFTNGILIGRMPIYFTIYNLYVLPWLIYNCYGHIRALVINGFILVYAVWFYVQMCIAWDNLPYVSYFLKIYEW